jgi:cytochrome oxidase Cu insertion factor (SCO1/SenC/PrrC family)
MRIARIASSVCSILLCSALAAAPAQDLYRTDGRWLDDGARPYRLESLHGSYTVLTMAYGACRRVCSTSLRVLQQVQVLADEHHLMLNFVVVGLDPDQDKPADWAELRRDRQLTRTNWRFLSGDEASTGRLAQRLGVHYWRYGEHTMHDFKIVLLSPEGQLVRSIDAFDQSPTLLLP